MNIPASAIQRLFHTRETMQAVLPFVHGDLLDFGSGQAKYKSLFLRRAKTYTSLDIDPQTKADIIADVLFPPLPDVRFDTIVSNQVIEHVQKPWLMIEQIARLLRPGGVCIITGPFLAPYHAHPHDFFRYTEQGIQALCAHAGLEVILCSKYGGFWACIAEMIKQCCVSPYKKQSRFKRFFISMVERICRSLNRFSPPGNMYANVLCVARKPLPR